MSNPMGYGLAIDQCQYPIALSIYCFIKALNSTFQIGFLVLRFMFIAVLYQFRDPQHVHDIPDSISSQLYYSALRLLYICTVYVWCVGGWLVAELLLHNPGQLIITVDGIFKFIGQVKKEE